MIKIHQETLGEGKSIVLIHGWGMHTGIWRDFARELSESYCVTCIDLPGHGQSEKLDPFTLELISETLVGSVSDEACCWLGWSLGATVVLDIASRFPERCKSLILLAGNPHFIKSDRWPGIRLQALNAFAGSLGVDSQATLLRFLSLQINGLANYKDLAKTLKRTISEYPAPDQETLRQGLRILKEADLRPALAKLSMPVSAILGNRDTLVPAEVGYEMQQLLPELELNIIDQAGHVPFLSHREELLSIISRFMDEQ
jgi:pimeloyl-[acyl-carrier protein] methyl ester esterase